MPSDGSRPATPDDVDAICLGLPEVELGISWGDRPTYKVPKGEKGRGFLLYRMPHKTAVDPETGEMYDDLLVIITPDRGREAGARRGRDDAVLHHRPLQRLQRGARPAVAPRRADPRRAGRDHHRRLGPPGAQEAGEAALRRWLTRPARRPTTCCGRSGSTTPTPTWRCATALRERGLSGRDAAFATELVSGTLRRRGTYDAVLAACVDRPLANTPAKVLDVLRLGVHQLLAMRVPAHAAISTTVDLAVARAGAGTGGFANAVLRKVSADDLAGWVARVAPDPTHRPGRAR